MGRPTAQYCRNGHDTKVLGRNANGTCVACHRDKARYYMAEHRERRKLGVSPGPVLRVSTQPLHMLLGWDPGTNHLLGSRSDPVVTRTANAWLRHRSCNWDSAKRQADRLLHSEEITVFKADEWCIALGLHLALVYPGLYWDEAG